MPLFLRLKPGFKLTEEVQARINRRLRQDCSPRHVPDRAYAVEAIPYTLTGKKMEVPVRKILMGWPARRRPPAATRWRTRSRSTTSSNSPESSDYYTLHVEWRAANDNTSNPNPAEDCRPEGGPPSAERAVDNVLGQQVMGDFRPATCWTPRAHGRWRARRPPVGRACIGFFERMGLSRPASRGIT